MVNTHAIGYSFKIIKFLLDNPHKEFDYFYITKKLRIPPTKKCTSLARVSSFIRILRYNNIIEERFSHNTKLVKLKLKEVKNV